MSKQAKEKLLNTFLIATRKTLRLCDVPFFVICLVLPLLFELSVMPLFPVLVIWLVVRVAIEAILYKREV